MQVSCSGVAKRSSWLTTCWAKSASYRYSVSPQVRTLAATLDPKESDNREVCYFPRFRKTTGRLMPRRAWLQLIDNSHKPRIAAKRGPGGIKLELPVIGTARDLR